MDNLSIRTLTADEIYPELLHNFRHQQHISQKWVHNSDKWELISANELRQWDEEKRIWITEYLREQINNGGSAIFAFNGTDIVGFCSVDGKLKDQYANITMLFVDDDWKRHGIGKRLFSDACEYSIKLGAKKLFISSIPSAETVAFYQALGCSDASEIIDEFIDTAEDRYMEFNL